jgi:hypothetical protein
MATATWYTCSTGKKLLLEAKRLEVDFGCSELPTRLLCAWVVKLANTSDTKSGRKSNCFIGDSLKILKTVTTVMHVYGLAGQLYPYFYWGDILCHRLTANC